MHIEPGLVSGAKIVLSYATAAAAGAYTLKLAAASLRAEGAASLALRSALATAAVFVFFEVLPHHPVGVSEVHLILGSTIFLLFGAAPAAIGLALGLLIQGMFFAPFDLPQYGMNVTTLLFPLFAVRALAARIVAPGTAYVDLKYRQALALSTAYQGGVVLWVAFWAVYGAGAGAGNLAAIASFGAAYMLVVVVEPLADLAVLAVAKALKGPAGIARGAGPALFVTPRLHNPA
ncbi:energy-coupling factor ABC transporter permease [Paracoccus sp. CPCC 101403]|uniref:Energy-coupling factor ABC transporter permease n=1 Tax=Paracoccus broussonetiae TaxID=3075834 RepID=A0ABU3EH99_9RHOB|nr:energy-coupling factor ABC transporter permease [Paracoccus sp. CPCC 101403]MDT1063618.1 energy-coupling factor ABC transporter permease [Paracoccus sp. CPCC 101403]